MKAQFNPNEEFESQIILDCLNQTAAQALERKRRLGQYAVIWSDGAPVMIGDDAPPQQNRSGNRESVK